MTIDTERLATDPAYWDEVAPEGATHYDPSEDNMKLPWFMFDGEKWMLWGGDWLDVCLSDIFYDLPDFIPRPTKPAAPDRMLNPQDFGAVPDWDGEGLPPVGCECEVKDTTGEWHECLVVGYNKSCAVFYCDNWTVDSDYDAFPASEFRPIRTKAQSQVFDLEWVIQKAYEQGDGGVDFNEFAKAIIAAGWKKDA